MKNIIINKKIKIIQKHIINIINKKFNYIFKINLISINYINIYKNMSKIIIYININKNKKKSKKILNILKTYNVYIKNKLIKKINFKNIPKIYFEIDKFYSNNKKLFNILNKMKNKTWS